MIFIIFTDWDSKPERSSRILLQVLLHQLWSQTVEIVFLRVFSWWKTAVTKCLWTYCFETHQREIMLCGTSNSSMHQFTPLFSASIVMQFFQSLQGTFFLCRTVAPSLFCTITSVWLNLFNMTQLISQNETLKNDLANHVSPHHHSTLDMQDH